MTYTAWAWISPENKLIRVWTYKPERNLERIKGFYGPGKLVEVTLEVCNEKPTP